ncbi:hypothetical protein OUZ56_015812 [Daphnia magna]|uniref:Uncharacterized protein n=1 Tax=Daphnia magna TaxID=35525 RepID=A0ABR0ANX0_9CRUS|nr:hypothetical protein OUZ56_015812 [Daphnia magna]
MKASDDTELMIESRALDSSSFFDFLWVRGTHLRSHSPDIETKECPLGHFAHVTMTPSEKERCITFC